MVYKHTSIIMAR